jgi:site-specific DNA recombinase
MRLLKGKRAPREYTTYLLTGVLTCGYCGKTICGAGKYDSRTNYRSYKCSTKQLVDQNVICENKKFRQDKLEKLVIDEIENNIMTKEAIEDITEKVTKLLESNENDISSIKTLESNKNSLESKMKRLIDIYLDGELTKSQYSEKLNTLKSELAQIKLKLHQLKKRPEIDPDAIRKYIFSFKSNLHNVDAQIKIRLIRTFIENIVVYRDHMHITFKIPQIEKSGGDEPPESLNHCGKGRSALPLYTFQRCALIKIIPQHKEKSAP